MKHILYVIESNEKVKSNSRYRKKRSINSNRDASINLDTDYIIDQVAEPQTLSAINILARNGLKTGPGLYVGSEIEEGHGLVYSPGFGLRGPYDLSYFHSPVNNYVESDYPVRPLYIWY